MTTIESLVLAERRGSVLILTLNRPARLNAWMDALEDQYFAALSAADDDPDVRAIVVTGSGRGFCAGADMDDLAAAHDLTSEDLLRPVPRDFPLSIRKPLIGAINGVAAGLGMVEALYFDVRFGEPSTRFITAFAKRGLIAEYAIASMLPRLVGPSRAADLLLSSRTVGAEEALRIGLLDHLVTDGSLLDAAVAYGEDLATSCSPLSMAIIKRQLAADRAAGHEAATRLANELIVPSLKTPDVAEGVASYLEKRAPQFPGLPSKEAL
jgi:enoyl-CoA hydratase/carnithine racemase